MKGTRTCLEISKNAVIANHFFSGFSMFDLQEHNAQFP